MYLLPLEISKEYSRRGKYNVIKLDKLRKNNNLESFTSSILNLDIEVVTDYKNFTLKYFERKYPDNNVKPFVNAL